MHFNMARSGAELNKNGTERTVGIRTTSRNRKKIEHGTANDQEVVPLSPMAMTSKRRQAFKTQNKTSSWVLINGEIDQLPVNKIPLKHGEPVKVNWSLSDGCWMWMKRVLSIANVIVSTNKNVNM